MRRMGIHPWRVWGGSSIRMFMDELGQLHARPVSTFGSVARGADECINKHQRGKNPWDCLVIRLLLGVYGYYLTRIKKRERRNYNCRGTKRKDMMRDIQSRTCKGMEPSWIFFSFTLSLARYREICICHVNIFYAA
ncbi:hypothetical protein ABW19_dt0202647 [Dactylella cylindrospora]|nr:hypothetical protein ABW19_dt0202647 [Dactylella cylindrospora]